MKKFIFCIIFISWLITLSNAFAANRVLHYGFEDWGGSVASTPDWPFSSNYSSYLASQEECTEVVSSYTPSGLSTWDSHSGSKFLLINLNNGTIAGRPTASPATDPIPLDPVVSGISNGTVAPSLNVGLEGTYPTTGYAFDVDDIDTGEIYISMWARMYGFVPDDRWGCLNGKWIQIFNNIGDDHALTVGMHTGSLSIRHYNPVNPAHSYRIYGGGTGMNDGNWHKFSVHIIYHSGQKYVRVWYDVTNETFENATIEYNFETDPDGSNLTGSGPGSHIVIQGNFSTYEPDYTTRTFMGLDDIEIWDGMPYSDPTPSQDNPPTVGITSPTSQESFTSDESAVNIAGGASDDNGISLISWTNDRGGQGTANNDSGDWTAWSIPNIFLQEGENIITVTATDTNNQTSTDTITVTYNYSGTDYPPGDVTDFTAQPGDSEIVLNWTNPTDSDFKGTLISYSTGNDPHPATHNDGTFVCDREANPDSSDSFPVTGLDNGTKYNFSAFTYDEDGNYSETAHISATPCADIYTKTFGDISGADFPQTCKDTYLNVGEAGVNYSSDSESLNTYTWPTNTAANRIVMKWDLSALPQDAIIQEATLSLYMHEYSGTGGDDNYEITAHKIINHNPDISSCTWNTYDGSNSWTGGANGGEQDIAPAESSTIVDKTSGYKNWNITQMVQEWADNSSTNLGLMLNSDTTAASDSNRYFRPTEYSNQDQRPVLTIKCCGIGEVPSVPTGLKKVDD